MPAWPLPRRRPGRSRTRSGVAGGSGRGVAARVGDADPRAGAAAHRAPLYARWSSAEAIMVGKGGHAESRDADREPRREAGTALSGAGGGARRSRAIPSTWSAAPCATCCSAAAGPTSTSSSRATPAALATSARRRAGRARALRHRQGRARRPRARHRLRPHARPTRAPGRCPRWQRRPASRKTSRRRDFTRQRDGDAAAGRARLIDPYDGRADLEREACCGFSTRTPSSTTRPGRSAPPATRRGSASRSSPRPSGCCARPTWRPSPPTAARPSCCGWPGEPTAPRGLRTARRVGPGRAAPARRVELVAAVGGAAGRPSPGAGSGRHRPGGARGGARASRERGRAGRRRSRSGPPRRSSLAPATTRSSSSSPARWAPSGSTTTSASGAGSSWRSTAAT